MHSQSLKARLDRLEDDDELIICRRCNACGVLRVGTREDEPCDEHELPPPTTKRDITIRWAGLFDN